MPKENMMLLRPPELPTFDVDVQTDWHPSGKFVFKVTKLSGMRLITAQGRGAELYQKIESGEVALPPVGEEAIIVSRETCIFAMALDLAQRGPIEDCYSATEILRMMAEDKVLMQLTDLRDRIMPDTPGADDDDGEDGDSDPLSSQPRPTAD